MCNDLTSASFVRFPSEQVNVALDFQLRQSVRQSALRARHIPCRACAGKARGCSNAFQHIPDGAVRGLFRLPVW